MSKQFELGQHVLNEALFYTSLWLVHNHYVLQIYTHAVTLAFM